MSVNLTMNNRRRIARSNWKSSERDPAVVVRKGVVAGNLRPLYNNDPNLTDNNANAFRARPLKLYRRQYPDTNNQDRISSSKNLLHYSLAPGGVNYTNGDCSNCSTIVGDEYSYTIDVSGTTYARKVEDNARTRARGAKTNINTEPTKLKYYTTNKSYLESRCKTYDQKNTI